MSVWIISSKCMDETHSDCDDRLMGEGCDCNCHWEEDRIDFVKEYDEYELSHWNVENLNLEEVSD